MAAESVTRIQIIGIDFIGAGLDVDGDELVLVAWLQVRLHFAFV